MKKLLFFSVLTISLLSCSKDDDSQDNPTGNNVDYEFAISINDKTTSIKGNTADGHPLLPGSTINNMCYIRGGSVGGSSLYLSMSDITEKNYISGKPIECWLYLPTLELGINSATVFLLGSLPRFETVYGTTDYNSYSELPINITDLGTEPKDEFGIGGFGRTIKGNYKGTVYTDPDGDYKFTTPVKLSIDFKALRYY